jgi:hypothetical protein
MPQLEQIEKLTALLGIGGYIALDECNIVNFLFYRDQALLAMKIIDIFTNFSHIDTPYYFDEEMQFQLQLFKTKIKQHNRQAQGQTNLNTFFK